jgi:carbon monoxide dehydrogenase subunit G
MPRLQFTATIAGSAESIFAVIADLAGYHRWLPGSDAFGAITEISSEPIGLGTTYVDAGPSGKRYGSITEYKRPTNIAFHQPMDVSGLLRGTIDITASYTLEPAQGGTRVIRDIVFQPHGLLRLAQPIIVSGFRRENKRVLAALKYDIEVTKA